MSAPEHATAPLPRSRASLVKLVVGALVLVAGVIFLAGPLGSIEVEEASAYLRDLGILGVLLFLAVFAVVQPLGISSHLFTFTATMVWEQPAAFLLTWVGATLATMSAFGFARYAARDWVQQKLPARFRDMDDRLEKKAFRTIFWLRVFFWCAPPVGFAMGASKVKGMTHHMASLLGGLPQLILSSFLAQGLKVLLEREGFSLGGLAAAGFGLLLVVSFAFLAGRKLLRPKNAG